MVWSNLDLSTILVLCTVLLAEAANGWTDAPCGTSSAVASGILTSRQALWLTAIGNFIGLIAAMIVGAAVATTIGKNIIQPEFISVGSIGIAMLTTIMWSMTALWLGLPISKTHSLLAALAGIGFASGGFDALLPASGNWHDSGWLAVAEGMGIAIICGSSVSWFLARVVKQIGLDETISENSWRKLQYCTVFTLASGHGFNDGLKYTGIFTLVLFKSGMLPSFTVLPSVLLLCAFVMTIGTLCGGWRIHRRLDGMVNHEQVFVGEKKKKPFRPYMGVCAEITSSFMIWQTGWLGLPTSTNHAAVSSMAGAKSASGKAHISSIVKIMWGWVITYVFCFWIAEYATRLIF